MILPIAESPITGLVDEAFPLIVALTDDRPWDWFYSNYIQIALKNDERRGYNIRFYKTDHCGVIWDTMNPWIKYNTIDVKLLRELGMGIIDFTVRSVDSGYYLSVYLDRFYVPGTRNAAQSHLTHEALVFGYEAETRLIYLMEYQGAYLTAFTMDYDAFAQAYAHADEKRCDAIRLLRPDTERRYLFDLQNVYEQMSDYLYSRNTTLRYRSHFNPIQTPFFVLGMDAYREVKRLLAYDHLQNDYRVFNSIWEHKKVMTARIRYMAERNIAEGIGDFLPLCEETENLSYLVKSQYMKFTVTQKEKTLQTVCALFDEMVGKEQTLIAGLLVTIQRQLDVQQPDNPGVWISRHDFVQGTHALDTPPAKRLRITFDIIPQHDVIDGVIGYGDSLSAPVGYSAMKWLIRLHPDGFILARNGDRYEAVQPIRYTRGACCHAEITVDFGRQTYDARVSCGPGTDVLADGYAFGPDARRADDLAWVTLTADLGTAYHIEHHTVTAG